MRRTSRYPYWLLTLLVFLVWPPSAAWSQEPGCSVCEGGRSRGCRAEVERINADPFPDLERLGLVEQSLAACRRVERAAEEDRRPRGPTLDMVRIEPGRFRMGSPANEEGRHDNEAQVEVEITRAFLLGRYEVTQGEWRALTRRNPSSDLSCGDRCPVESVSWWDAVAYANGLSEQEGLQECYALTGCNGTPGTSGTSGYACSGVTFAGLECTGYRLPTEAEWEYAARGGTAGARYGDLDAVAWYDGNSGGRTHEVGGKQANVWGLCDMLGNVWEWTNDWYVGQLSGGQDPLGPLEGPFGVVRGGSAGGDASYVRGGFRSGIVPGDRRNDLGFRLARTAP